MGVDFFADELVVDKDRSVDAGGVEEICVSADGFVFDVGVAVADTEPTVPVDGWAAALVDPDVESFAPTADPVDFDRWWPPKVRGCRAFS